MKIKKLDKNQYEIINDDYIIYISKEQNPKTKKLYLYFIDVFEHNNKNACDSEVFDELYLSKDYIQDNYLIHLSLTNQIKL